MFTENPEDFLYNSSIGVHAVSPEGIIVYANKCELEVLGYSKSEYIGHHVSEFQIDESCFWIEILIETNIVNESMVADLLKEGNELLAISSKARKNTNL